VEETRARVVVGPVIGHQRRHLYVQFVEHNDMSRRLVGRVLAEVVLSQPDDRTSVESVCLVGVVWSPRQVRFAGEKPHRCVPMDVTVRRACSDELNRIELQHAYIRRQ